jgi:hypothetical protein
MRSSYQTIPKSTAVPSALAAKELLKLSGSALLNRILDEESPKVFIRRLSEEDFFWIVKRIGEADCLPLLRLASKDQWEYLLDLETWEKDRLDADRVLSWLSRLSDADPARFAVWLFSQGDALFSLLINEKAEVIIRDGEGEADLSEGYFTLDGLFYIRPIREEDREAIEGLLRTLAGKDHHAYQALLYGLAAVIPAEVEEELYRFRNGRLAEHGFLSYEEAVAVYAPLDPAVLRAEKPPLLLPGRLCSTEEGALIPVSPLMHVGEDLLFAEALSRIGDPLLQDRICLEFAGLCNRIVSADASAEEIDSELLSASCRRAASYLNLALERLCGKDAEAAARLLQDNSLLTIFRVGYGLAMKMRWEVQSWRKKSLFFQNERTNSFWGTPWEETLEGLCAVRPIYFAGKNVQNPYQDFRTVEDLEETYRRMDQVKAIDRLLMDLSIRRGESIRLPAWAETFHPLLFNRWARAILGIEMSPAPLTRKQAEHFFRLVRRNDKGPPYRMAGFKEFFIDDLTRESFDVAAETVKALREALSLIWDAFCQEYESVAAGDLWGRYSRYLRIASGREVS